jgi:hypothetical protein
VSTGPAPADTTTADLDPDNLENSGASAIPRCSVAARARDDELAGTALPTSRFLLVEDRGPWGPAPHPVGSLPPDAATHVQELARRTMARLVLIRRTGRHAGSPARTWAMVDTAAATVRSGRVDHVDDLASFDPGTDGHDDPEPWYLVCTQGRHDVCCAVYGRPVVLALSRLEPDRTWECTHVGGDRFAANVLLMPAGLVYGHVDPGSVGELVRAYADGRVVPAGLRGRCGTVPAAQAAEHHARLLVGDDRIEAFAPPQVVHDGRDRWTVTLDHPSSGSQVRVELVERHDEVPVGLTCAATGPGRLRRWELLGLELASQHPLVG